MQSTLSPDHTFTKGESTWMKRMPLAMISLAENKTIPGSQPSESSIFCKRIDNSAQFVGLTYQAQPKKFTPLAIPLEPTKKRCIQASPLHTRNMLTESAMSVQNSITLQPQALRPETAESYRSSNKKRPSKELNTANSASLSSRIKAKQQEALEKKDIENKKVAPPVKSRSLKDKELPKSHRAFASPVITRKKSPLAISKQASEKKVSHKKPVKATDKFSRTNARLGGQESIPTEQPMERSPPRDTTELDKFVQYNALRILEQMREQKRQDEFEKHLSEERRVALDEGNKRIREANFIRFNLNTNHRPAPHQRAAWGADQRRLARPAYSPSQRARKPKIEDGDRRKTLGLDHVNEETLERLRNKMLMSFKQESIDKSQEHSRAKRQFTIEEHENLQRYMVEKKFRMEIEMREKKRQEFEDFEKKRRNLERLFSQIRSAQVVMPTPKLKKKPSKRTTKKRKSSKPKTRGQRDPQLNTEPNDMYLDTQESEENQREDENGILPLEILEAAAIFIQKNYRGYKTRQAVAEYLYRVYELNQGEYYEQEEGEEEEEEDKRQKLQQSAAKRQKLEQYQEDVNTSDRIEEVEDEGASARVIPGGRHVVDEYRKLKDQYQMFYDQDGLHGDKDANEGTGTEEYLNNEEEEEEGNKVGKDYQEKNVKLPKRAKSDGIIEHQPDSDEEDLDYEGYEEEYEEGAPKGGYLQGYANPYRERIEKQYENEVDYDQEYGDDDEQ